MKKLPKCYKSYSKKELRKALLKEMQCNIQIVEDNWNIVQENMRLHKEKEQLEWEIAKNKFITNLSSFLKELWNDLQNEQPTKSKDTEIDTNSQTQNTTQILD